MHNNKKEIIKILNLTTNLNKQKKYDLLQNIKNIQIIQIFKKIKNK